MVVKARQLAVMGPALILLACSWAPFTDGFALLTTGVRERSSREGLSPTTAAWIVMKGSKDEELDAADMAALEREVLDSTRATLDQRLVMSVLLDGEESSTHEMKLPSDVEEQYSPPPQQWQIALAAASLGAGTAYFAMGHSLMLSSIVLVAIFVAGNGDPLEEDGIAGALARLVGRATLQSVEASKPKVRAVAKAVVRGEDEVESLRARVSLLEAENEELRLWKQNRMAVDARLGDYTLGELKDYARTSGLLVGGTKAQLLMRLVEADVIQL